MPYIEALSEHRKNGSDPLMIKIHTEAIKLHRSIQSRFASRIFFRVEFEHPTFWLRSRHPNHYAKCYLKA